MRPVRPAAALLLLPLLAGWGVGCAAYELDAHGGYSRLSADAPAGSAAFFDGSDALRLAAGGSRSVVIPGFLRGDGGVGPRLGLNASYTAASEGVGGQSVGQPAQTAAAGDADVWIVSPQATASFRLALGGFFLEPGIGGGLAYGEIDVDYVNAAGTRVRGDDSDISYAYRPFLRAGRVGPRLILAVEGGYEKTGLNFDVGPGRDYGNWYVGATVGVRLTR